MTSNSISVSRRPVLDLELRDFETTINGIHVIGTWFMDEETRRSQPCLVLMDATRRTKRGRVIPCVITLDQAWRWAPDIGEPEHCWPIIRDWIKRGALPGSAANDRDLWAVLGAVHSRLRDMMMMPPIPAKGAIKHKSSPETPFGMVTIRNDSTGKVLHQAEVTGHV
ncbi:hypothetical protein PAF17_16000 [Paracoccus sp. Z330]|uniref:Uncharacterized protein n=1 Tax=Paracoccus onchidii TaxID=3017813 RepID=A0ABT4ZJV0_9RHOB|nr:hypothetical protein [Paracoccus onchidii]MDB6178995.1 hypothetical protein [Paracoccus onchidii]